MNKTTLRIGKKDIEVKHLFIDQNDLKYYPQNPRIYTLLNVSEDNLPNQEEIQNKLQKMDHVNKLVQSIEANGGLIDPIVVRDGDYVVVEGNSRLAAYRKLYKKDPAAWEKIKCILLPKETSDDSIFILLGQYHIIGRKDWAPFEQAAYLYRRKKNTAATAKEMADEMGDSESVVASMIRVYEYMLEKNDLDINRWSYYDELLKSKHIDSKMESIPGLETKIVTDIQNGGIEKARDIRKLAEICKVNNKNSDKLLKKYVKGDMPLEECIECAKDSGDTNAVNLRLNKFRTFLAELDSPSISKLEKEPKDKILFELKKIHTNIKALLDNIK